jgi:RNase P subunit RPR2|tara:strand:- start:427 stop:564 length:138 start_codon:yes stop_codon:yes gene_type:complete
MKCLVCKEGELKMSFYKKTNYKYSANNKEIAVLVCNNCGHKERFG